MVDHDNHCIQKFTANGQFLTAVGTLGDGPLEFKCMCVILAIIIFYFSRMYHNDY